MNLYIMYFLKVCNLWGFFFKEYIILCKIDKELKYRMFCLFYLFILVLKFFINFIWLFIFVIMNLINKELFVWMIFFVFNFFVSFD